MNTLSQLRDFAIERHGAQRYGNRPYVDHLDEVAGMADRHGLPEVYKRSAYGHDLKDDTATTHEEVVEVFGPQEALLIHAVSGPGDTRAARRAETLRRLFAHPEGADLKGIDRICNVRACLRDEDHKRLRMYLDEEAAFAPVFALARPSIQAELQGLYDQARDVVASARCGARLRP